MDKERRHFIKNKLQVIQTGLEILLDKVADDPSVLVLTETTSNLHNKRFIKSIDNLIFNLTKEEFSDLQPDLLLTFGGLIVSKKIKKSYNIEPV